MPTLPQSSISGAAYSTPESLYSLPRHRWYVIKEGFSPDLLGAALQESPISKNDVTHFVGAAHYL